jgi:hypothetical protein
MAVFLVFRDLPGLTRDQYSAAQRAIADAARQAVAGGPVRYQGGFFLPHAGRGICVFDAGSADDVTAVNQQAGVPFTDLQQAIDLRSDEPRPGAQLSSPRG